MLSVSESISMTSIQALRLDLFNTMESRGIKKYIKLTGYSIICAMTAIATLVEGLARIAFAMLGKFMTFFIPKQWSTSLDRRIENLTVSSGINFAWSCIYSFSTVGIFLSREKLDQCLMRAQGKFFKISEKLETPVRAFSTLHFNGRS